MNKGGSKGSCYFIYPFPFPMFPLKCSCEKHMVLSNYPTQLKLYHTPGILPVSPVVSPNTTSLFLPSLLMTKWIESRVYSYLVQGKPAHVAWVELTLTTGMCRCWSPGSRTSPSPWLQWFGQSQSRAPSQGNESTSWDFSSRSLRRSYYFCSGGWAGSIWA